MAVQFACPECGKVLKSSNPLTPGKKVKCPACAAIFSPGPAKPAAPVAKKPVEDDETIEMSRTKPTGPPGKKAPKPAPLEDDLDDMEDDLPPPRAKAPMPVKKTSPPIDDDDDEDEDDDLPPRGKAGIQAKKPAPRMDDEDEDDDLPPAKPAGKPGAISAKKPVPPANDFGFGNEDLEDDLPPMPMKGKKGPPPAMKKGKPRDDDEDEDDDFDDRPMKKGKPVTGKKKSSSKLFILIGLLLLLIALGAVAAFVWPGFMNTPPNTGPIRTTVPNPTPPPIDKEENPGPKPGPTPVVPDPMPKTDDMKAEAKADPDLQGKWKLVLVYDKYQGADKSYIVVNTKDLMTIKDNEMSMEMEDDGKKVTMKYKLELDQSRTPKVYRQTSVEEKDNVLSGIYSVEKGKLLMCFQDDGKAPEAFVVVKDDGKNRRILEFERVP